MSKKTGLNIIIVGCGKVGIALIEQLSKEGHDITIVDNSSLRVVYETIVPAGDTTAFVSTAGLSPDTEYTIYAKATYKVDDVEYTRSFVNKIFRNIILN